MKKILILPSTTGQGDLSVASLLAETLKKHFHVLTAYFAENAHSPVLSEVAGQHVLFPASSHPDHSKQCETQLSSLAAEIRKHAPDVVIALNESFFALGAFLAGRPVIQLTHLLDQGLVTSGRWIAKKAINKTIPQRTFHDLSSAMRGDHSTLFTLLKNIRSSQRPSALVRIVRKIRKTVTPLKTSRLRMELISRYGQIVGSSYLSQLISDELIVHSIFHPQEEAIRRINSDRRAFGNSPVKFAASIRPQLHSLPKISCKKTKRLLLTFGGIDHTITPGMLRLLRVFNVASGQFTPGQIEVQIAGRVVETKRSFFASNLEQNPLFKNGAIKLHGSVNHDHHLQLIRSADLIITQPGYSTLCELVSAQKPFILFYGLAPYYEQFSNFVAAHKGGLALNYGRSPWFQVGEYARFGSRRFAREPLITSHLAHALGSLIRGELCHTCNSPGTNSYPHFSEIVAARARHLSTIFQEKMEVAI